MTGKEGRRGVSDPLVSLGRGQVGDTFADQGERGEGCCLAPNPNHFLMNVMESNRWSSPTTGHWV